MSRLSFLLSAFACRTITRRIPRYYFSLCALCLCRLSMSLVTVPRLSFSSLSLATSRLKARSDTENRHSRTDQKIDRRGRHQNDKEKAENWQDRHKGRSCIRLELTLLPFQASPLSPTVSPIDYLYVVWLAVCLYV